jgi:hypothetical protein
MPERIYALYHYRADEKERAQQMFLDAGLLDVVVSPERLSGFQKLALPNEAVVQRLTFAAAANSLKPPAIRRYLEPTKKELRAAPLLYVRVGEHHSSDGHPRPGTTYDETNACAWCGAGLRQTSPLQLRNKEIPKKGMVAGVGDELLLHESVAGVLAAARFRGVRLTPVLDASGSELPWRQLVVEQHMPLMLLGTRGVIRGRTGGEQPCARCGRDGHFDSGDDPFIPAYSASAISTMPDAAWTAERFGTGAWGDPVHGKRSLADRRLIVRPVVYALLEPLKLRGLRWSPVRVV